MNNGEPIANLSPQGDSLVCEGSWKNNTLHKLGQSFKKLLRTSADTVVIDGSGLIVLDSAGAWQLQRCAEALRAQGKTVTLQGFNEKQQALFKMIESEATEIRRPIEKPRRRSWLYWLGYEAVVKFSQANRFLNFFGEVVVNTIHEVIKPRCLQLNLLMNVIEHTGYRALPIVGLLSFLIGVVLAYQMGLQLKPYGANIFIVDISGMAILREFGPLIAAIIVAGRTASSYTAQIGMMKLNEEIDALQTMGLSPVERIVMPKILGLILAMPLITVWADAFGVLGSMAMAKHMLSINFYDFLVRFQAEVGLRNYTIGLIKAPVFALLISCVGCFQGFQVQMSSESVGFQTTKSVVQAIFLIIIADAIFSIFFSWQGI